MCDVSIGEAVKAMQIDCLCDIVRASLREKEKKRRTEKQRTASLERGLAESFL